MLQGTNCGSDSHKLNDLHVLRHTNIRRIKVNDEYLFKMYSKFLVLPHNFLVYYTMKGVNFTAEFSLLFPVTVTATSVTTHSKVDLHILLVYGITEKSSPLTL
jgi:hypothetical protein